MTSRARADEARRPRRGRVLRRRRGLVIAACLLLVLIGCGAWLGVRASLARADLGQAEGLAHQFASQMSAGDFPASRETAQKLKERVDSARQLVGDPIWRAAGVLPVVGENFSNTATMTSVLSEVVDGAVVPIASATNGLDMSKLKPVDGALDLHAFDDLRAAVSQADPVLASAHATVTDLPKGPGLLPQISSGIDSFSDALGKAHQQAAAGNQTLQLLPGLLGADGPRNYLLLFQNNAELRSTGGIPGAIALVHVENGRLSLTEHTAAKDFPEFPEPVLPLSPQTQGLYGAITGKYMQDVTLTPRFPLAASLAAEMWRRQHHTNIDGVIGLDPIALSYMLEATGPVPLPSGDVLDSGNAVKTLLSDAYFRYRDTSEKDDYFAVAASAFFSKVSTGAFEPKAMFAALERSATERRLLMWSARTEEQSSLKDAGLDGSLPAQSPERPVVGVYLNDATGSKMDYYLKASYGIGGRTCRADGRPEWSIDVTLANIAPQDAARSLPPYVTGAGGFGVPPGQIKTQVGVYAPPDSVYLGTSENKSRVDVHTDHDGDFPVAQTFVMLRPGEAKTLRFTFLGSPGAATEPGLVSTPTVNQMTTLKTQLSCGSELG